MRMCFESVIFFFYLLAVSVMTRVIAQILTRLP